MKLHEVAKKPEAKKPYVSGLIAALNEVGLSSVKDCLAWSPD